MLVEVLCIDNLHRFPVDSGETNIACPECGCHYVRKASERTPEGVPVAGGASKVKVVVEKGRYNVGTGESFISDPKTFVKTVKRLMPEMSDRELKSGLNRWFPEE